MKKLLALITALAMIISLSACASGATTSFAVSERPSPDVSESPPAVETPFIEDPHEIAMITNGGAVDADLFNLRVWQGVERYADEYGRTSAVYEPEGGLENLSAAMTKAVENGAAVLILPGSIFGPAIAVLQEKYPGVMFLGINVSEDDLTDSDGNVIPAAANTSLIVFREEEAGFLAGYAAVMNGFTSLGFIGSLPVPSVVRYGYGFIQGADAAAALLSEATKTKVKIDVQYSYAGVTVPDKLVSDTAEQWYDSGTEVVFACGGAISASVIEAADKASTELIGKYVIGCNVDQSEQSKRVLTSAMKELAASAALALTDLYDHGGTWPEKYAGKCLFLGAKEGMVGLPTAQDAWRLKLYPVGDYEILFDKLRNGELKVDASSDLETLPKTTNTVVTIDN